MINLKDVINELEDLDYISTSYLQRKYSLSFPKANEIIKKLIEKKYIEEAKTIQGHKVIK